MKIPIWKDERVLTPAPTNELWKTTIVIKHDLCQPPVILARWKFDRKHHENDLLAIQSWNHSLANGCGQAWHLFSWIEQVLPYSSSSITRMSNDLTLHLNSIERRKISKSSCQQQSIICCATCLLHISGPLFLREKTSKAQSSQVRAVRRLDLLITNLEKEWFTVSLATFKATKRLIVLQKLCLLNTRIYKVSPNKR